MYYNLIASLPHLPHFEQVDYLPITARQLELRLKVLKPEHADQLSRVREALAWRATSFKLKDKELVDNYLNLLSSDMDASLKDFLRFRLDQQSLITALRYKHDEVDLPEGLRALGAGSRNHSIQRNWNVVDFGLTYVYPWLTRSREMISAGDALGLERILIDLNWRWLSQCSERNVFGFQGVFSYVFKWDMLQAWLACDEQQAKVRFAELVDKVTHAEHN